MTLQQIRDIAKQHGIKAGKLPKAELIHHIQRQEGNHDCYANPDAASCDQMGCLWREDCLASASQG